MADKSNGTCLVIIIGAGCTGLALAQGLKKVGISCKIFERRESLSAANRDWNMGLHWGAPMLESLMSPEMWAGLQTLQVDPAVPTRDEDVIQFLNGQTGQLMASVPANKFYRLRRSKLRACLLDGLDIEFDKSAQNIKFSTSWDDASKVTVQFSDGSQQSGCLVVGADGANSTVRRLLLGPEHAAPVRLPYAATFAQSSYSRDQALYLRQFHPLFIAAIHPLGRFAFLGMHNVPDPTKPETWIFFMYISWPWTIEQQDESRGWTNEQQLDQLKQLAKDFTDPWKSAFEWLPAETPVWHLGLRVWDPSQKYHRWDTHDGRVTLAGDAAHPMTYRKFYDDWTRRKAKLTFINVAERGQGLNHSITDAGHLRDVLVAMTSGGQSLATATRVDQGNAIAKYEEEMKRRSGEEVKLSAKNTEMLHDWNLVRQSPLFRSGMAKA